MKTQLQREWLFWILILSPLIMIAAKWNEFQDRIPTHWNLEGDIDQYGGKWALFLSPAINLGIYLLMLVLPKIDPRKKNYDLFGGVYFIIRISLTVFLSMLGFITCLAALGTAIDVGLIMKLSMIALFLIFGNSFGKIRPNYFVGLRTPWTLNNEEVWMKAHRFTGKLWVIGALLLIPALFLMPKSTYGITLGIDLTVMIILPVIYSWAIHKKITQKNVH